MMFMNKGFSIFEFVIVIAILVAISVISIQPLASFRDTQVLNFQAREISSVIKEARSRTLGSKDLSQYGVHFSENEIILFKGVNFVTSDPDNETFSMNILTKISVINFNGGGSDLVFQRLTGQTNNYGTTTVSLKSDSLKLKSIVILKTGIIGIK